MARISGRNADILFAGQSLRGSSNRWTLSVDQQTAEVTAFGDTAQEHVLASHYGWTVEWTSFWNGGATLPEGLLHTNLGSGPLGMTLGPEGTAAGKVRYSGSAIIQTWNVETPLEGAVVLRATARGTGVLTRGTTA